MDYTAKLEDILYNQWEEYGDYVIEPEELIDFINDPNSFRDFGEALKGIIRMVMPLGTDKSEKEFLQERADIKGIVFNRNTLNNWFLEGKRPKKSDLSREHMYEISFALDLNIQQVAELFQKVYYDKPFNMRNPKEFIYYYCLLNKLSYNHALQLIDNMNHFSPVEGNNETTLMTKVLQSKADSLASDHDILNYIHTHPHNFTLNNVQAKRILSELRRMIIPSEEESKKIKENDWTNIHSVLGKEWNTIEYSLFREYFAKKSLTSVSTMLDAILNIDIVKTRQFSTESILKNANIPQEIKNRFPSKHVFSKENPSYEELRKMIILLKSYQIWIRKKCDFEAVELEDYLDEMNAILFDAGLQEMYAGNPYDWLFMYCSVKDDSLDCFREIMSEVLIPE